MELPFNLKYITCGQMLLIVTLICVGKARPLHENNKTEIQLSTTHVPTVTLKIPNTTFTSKTDFLGEEAIKTNSSLLNNHDSYISKVNTTTTAVNGKVINQASNSTLKPKAVITTTTLERGNNVLKDFSTSSLVDSAAREDHTSTPSSQKDGEKITSTASQLYNNWQDKRTYNHKGETKLSSMNITSYKSEVNLKVSQSLTTEKIKTLQEIGSTKTHKSTNKIALENENNEETLHTTLNPENNSIYNDIKNLAAQHPPSMADNEDILHNNNDNDISNKISAIYNGNEINRYILSMTTATRYNDNFNTIINYKDASGDVSVNQLVAGSSSEAINNSLNGSSGMGDIDHAKNNLTTPLVVLSGNKQPLANTPAPVINNGYHVYDAGKKKNTNSTRSNQPLNAIHKLVKKGNYSSIDIKAHRSVVRIEHLNEIKSPPIHKYHHLNNANANDRKKRLKQHSEAYKKLAHLPPSDPMLSVVYEFNWDDASNEMVFSPNHFNPRWRGNTLLVLAVLVIVLSSVVVVVILWRRRSYYYDSRNVLRLRNFHGLRRY